ncbi:MAG: hypothetical protein ACOX7P_04275 [Oscillospiraceae bacterium]|jgi:epoxyqueuosine reductase
MQQLKKEITDFLMNNGMDMIGIANVERFSEAPEGTRPEDVLPGAKSVIVFAVHIPDGLVDSLPSPSYQAQGYIVLTEMLNELGFKLAVFLERKGYKTLPIPASYNVKSRTISGEWPNVKIESLATFSHRHAAEKAGLGRIGKNNLLITKEYGARIRIQSVITTAELEPDPMIEDEICTCKVCAAVEACPAKALGDRTTDYYKCARRQRFVMDENDPNFIARDKAFYERTLAKKNQHPLEWSSELIAHTDYGSTSCGICLRECVLGKQSAKRRLK